MKLTIECDICGNKHIMSAPAKKYLQIRDNLGVGGFHYDDSEIKEGNLKELRISCSKCGNWISLGFN